MASFVVELNDTAMQRVQNSHLIAGVPATLAQLADLCVDFLAQNVQSVEQSAAIADAVSRIPPLDRAPSALRPTA